jgi:hypothetical protein
MNRLLRETIEEMTADMYAPTDTLARKAMTQGGRIRRRRHLAAAATAVAVIAAITIPLLFLPRGGGGPAAAGPQVITEQPTTLAGGWLVNSAGRWYLDRERQKYVQLADSVLRAPTGDRVVRSTPDRAFELTTVTASEPLTVQGRQFRGDLQWAPSGDRLVGMISQKEPSRVGFGIIDAATGTVTEHWIDTTVYDCSECTFSWSRDGREVVLAIADRSGGEAAELVARLQLFDAATGRPTRSLPVKAMPSSPFAWSPDGRFVIADADVLSRRPQLVDVATGTAKPFPYNAVWATDVLLLVPQDGMVLTVHPDGTVVKRSTLGGAFTGEKAITLGPPA